MNIYETKQIKDILKNNSYVGRGIIIGKTKDDKNAVIAYFIMGRSKNSQNRIFVENGEEVVIYPFDKEKVEDPSLIIYSPIKVLEKQTIVTNGDQTDTIYKYLKQGKTFEQALETREFEPDAPNYTPRISGIVDTTKNEFTYKMSILKSADEFGSKCNRYTFSYNSLPGIGHFIHTYMCDGNPIPTFQGEPERIEIPNEIETFTNEIWSNLNEQNKISLYVRYINLQTGKIENRLINKN